jgi:hypothetical protein
VDYNIQRRAIANVSSSKKLYGAYVGIVDEFNSSIKKTNIYVWKHPASSDFLGKKTIFIVTAETIMLYSNMSL